VSSPVECLQTLLDQQVVASLAVLDQGSPALSLVPYVVLRDPLRLFILISDLSPHTQALRADPRCGVLIHEPPTPEDPRSNHGLPRLSFQATAQLIFREDATELGIDQLYRAKYPIAEMLLSLGDFHFCQITPSQGSLIQGFGKAYKLSGSNFENLDHQTGK